MKDERSIPLPSIPLPFLLLLSLLPPTQHNSPRRSRNSRHSQHVPNSHRPVAGTRDEQRRFGGEGEGVEGGAVPCEGLFAGARGEIPEFY